MEGRQRADPEGDDLECELGYVRVTLQTTTKFAFSLRGDALVPFQRTGTHS